MPTTIQPRGQSVLIIEDDARTRTLLVMLLSQLGYDTVPVATIAQSLERLDGQAFAILDLNLPDGLGTVVLERIRSEGRPIRVAVTTGTSEHSLLQDAARLLPELILRKPINVGIFLNWLESSDRTG